MMKLKTCLSLLAAATLGLATPPVAAQTYPAKSIKLIVPFSAGGTTDILARAVGVELTKAWGQSVIIDNRPGAGGNVGSEAVAKSPADG